MMTLLIMKSKIKNFYEKHYLVVRGVLRVVLVFLSMMIIKSQLDYNTLLSHPLVILLIALACGFLPDMVSVAVILLMTCAEVAEVSLLLAFTILVLVVIYFLLFGRLGRKQSFIVFLIPLLSAINFSYIVPIVAALFVSPVLLPALIMGIVLQFMMAGVAEYVAATAGANDTSQTLAALQYMIDYLLQNKMILVTILAFSLAFLCVYIIRKREMKHGSQIAILVGTILLMAVELLSNIMLDLDMNLMGLTIEVLLSMAVAYMIQFFHMTLDYHGTRKLQFEDDEYYYYVTAIPKYKVAARDKMVTRIVPEDTTDIFDLKEELEKALEEEKKESETDSFE